MKCSNRIPATIYHLRCMATFVVAMVFSAGSFAQRYPFHNLSVDDGLIQSQATCLAQDKMGNLWIGTLGGLSRYDGRNFTNYTVRNGLQNNVVQSVAVDSAGSIWIGGPSGISQFNGRKFTHYSRPQAAMHANNNSQQIQIVNDTTWWRVQGEIYFVTKGKIKYFVTPGPEGIVSSFLADKDGLWIAKEGVLYHYDNTRWDTVRFQLAEDQKAPAIYRIFKDRGLIVWLSTSAGLYSIENGALATYSINGEPLTYPALRWAVTRDKAGALWFGTNSGIVRILGNSIQYYNKHNGLSDNTFNDLLTDTEGNVWMASDGQGIFRFSGTQFATLDEAMGLPSAQVMAIASNKRDSLFIGTYDAGLYIFKEGKVSTLAFPSNLVPGITSLCYTHHSKLWIGTRGSGLWSYEDGIFRQYVAPDRGFPSNFIHGLYEDHMKRLWIGFSNGAMVFENDSFKTVASKNLAVASFLDIGGGKILMAGEGKLLQYADGEVTDFITNTIADLSLIHISEPTRPY